MSLTIQDFLRLREEKMIVDVRSEGEYQAGHIRNAINIPILNNEERKVVGTTYKTQGKQLAIEEGIRLVGPRLYDIVHETQRVADGKEILVHCWRGGMRSNNFCKLVNMAGVHTRSLVGGYKSYRHQVQESFQSPFKLILVGGCTGSGKSDVIKELKNQGEQVLHLEALANHRGSAFGGLLMPPQPTTEQFENELFEEILNFDLTKKIWVEDESITIGKVTLPQAFWQHMRTSPVIKMDVTKEVRIHRLVHEYGLAEPESILKSMNQIVKRLGGQNFNAAKEKYLQGDIAATVDILLTYYDKTYLESLERRKDKIAFSLSWSGEDISGFVNELISKNIND